ncbi:hypothetical protein BDZ91DRAFT_119488 [Kalaharituber pfeilii]|nr:hypothetical protein BDZ91DRAFT_119488 [Kalaharituber pfeilii]
MPTDGTAPNPPLSAISLTALLASFRLQSLPSACNATHPLTLNSLLHTPPFPEQCCEHKEWPHKKRQTSNQLAYAWS